MKGISMSEKNHQKNGLVEDLKQSIEGCFENLAKKEKESKEYAENILRLRAEFENYKKRVERDKTEYVKFANEELISDLLPIYEHFKFGLESAKQSGEGEIFRGMEMIFKSLETVLFKNGLKKIEALGNIFDPNLHEVVEIVNSDKDEDNVVIEQIQDGYTLNGVVIKPVKVKIAKNNKEQDEQQKENSNEQER